MDEEDAAPVSVSLPWIEKYRPSALEDLVAHEEIISVLTRLIDNNQLPHLLFYGPPGTGKKKDLYDRILTIRAPLTIVYTN